MGFFAYPGCCYHLPSAGSSAWVPPTFELETPSNDLDIPPGPPPERFRLGGANGWDEISRAMRAVLMRDPVPVNLDERDWSNPCRDVDREPGVYAPWACRRLALGLDAQMGVHRRDALDAEIEAVVSEEDGRYILRWASFLWRCHGFCLID